MNAVRLRPVLHAEDERDDTRVELRIRSEQLRVIKWQVVVDGYIARYIRHQEFQDRYARGLNGLQDLHPGVLARRADILKKATHVLRMEMRRLFAEADRKGLPRHRNLGSIKGIQALQKYEL